MDIVGETQNAEPGWSGKTGQPLDLILSVVFGEGGNAAPFLGTGWLRPNARNRWAVGEASTLRLPNPGPCDALLLIESECAVPIPGLDAQALDVEVNGHPAGRLFISRGRLTLGLLVPYKFFRTADLDIKLRFPNAGRPIEFGHPTGAELISLAFTELRLFAAARSTKLMIRGTGGFDSDDVVRRAGISPPTLMARFESLGDNCEFGLVQRRGGAEPLGLLRFTGITLAHLHQCLKNRFEGLGEIENLTCVIGNGAVPEYVIRDEKYKMNFYTYAAPGSVDPEELRQKTATRIKFLVRKFNEDLDSGHKIGVIRRNPETGQIDEPYIWALLVALQQRGPCTLLWMSDACEVRPAGTVERVAPGLLRGYLAHFAPNSNAHNFELGPWLEVCANAVAIIDMEKKM